MLTLISCNSSRTTSNGSDCSPPRSSEAHPPSPDISYPPLVRLRISHSPAVTVHHQQRHRFSKYQYLYRTLRARGKTRHGASTQENVSPNKQPQVQSCIWMATTYLARDAMDRWSLSCSYGTIHKRQVGYVRTSTLVFFAWLFWKQILYVPSPGFFFSSIACLYHSSFTSSLRLSRPRGSITFTFTFTTG